MQFFQSFSSLGYSAIILVISTLFISVVVFNVLKLRKYGWVPKLILFALTAVAIYFSTIYLASERKIMMDAIRDEGGLKRTQNR